ncbi:DUF1259 domain-containing protein [Christiangramia sp.]|uniref:DUF1259 domain-containing protein n=1 Tax=Christiangramia sp. TaxID=1931228 RepID=UPI0026152E09|nr:DUF1259 domain-containing protein [Christiangramia sp.]
MKPLYLLLICSILFSCQETPDKKKKNKLETSQEVDEQKELNTLNIAVLEEALGIKGKENEGEYKVTIPQNDLKVTVDGFKIIPPMGLGSWVAFTPTNDQSMIMGDVVVTEQDLKPVQQEIIKQGLTITAIHNHFVRNEPDVMYMHIGGMGNEEELAKNVKAVFNKVKEIRGGDPSASPMGQVENTLDTNMIDSIVGYNGSMNNGVYKITIGRPDVALKDHGAPVSTFMGFNTWASWQGTPERAAVAGDFTMLENEVAPVIKALIENDIEVVALHNHMVKEEPRIFFLHYWGVGPAEKLAKGLKAALDQTGTGDKN